MLQEESTIDSTSKSNILDLIKNGDWERLKQTGIETSKLDEAYDYNSGGNLWDRVLTTRENDSRFTVQPEFQAICVLALYGINFGPHEERVFKAFQPGFFGLNKPKETLIQLLRTGIDNSFLKERIELGLKENGQLLRILRSEGPGKSVELNQWENMARNTLEPSRMTPRYHKK